MLSLWEHGINSRGWWLQRTHIHSGWAFRFFFIRCSNYCLAGFALSNMLDLYLVIFVISVWTGSKEGRARCNQENAWLLPMILLWLSCLLLPAQQLMPCSNLQAHLLVQIRAMKHIDTYIFEVRLRWMCYLVEL